MHVLTMRLNEVPMAIRLEEHLGSSQTSGCNQRRAKERIGRALAASNQI